MHAQTHVRVCTTALTLSPTPSSFALVVSGKKCSNTASGSRSGVNGNGHCEAGNGGTLDDCLQCVLSNSACSDEFVNWQPAGGHYCKCVAAGDQCSARATDANYEVYRYATASPSFSPTTATTTPTPPPTCPPVRPPVRPSVCPSGTAWQSTAENSTPVNGMARTAKHDTARLRTAHHRDWNWGLGLRG